ncbi:MAG: hypothetical protein IKQ29_01860 [Bacilli bacterium]|nr:hypothetical protein [Bacilli bacterium]
MANKNYYNYYEIIFSLRKEYLKNQEIINKLLSYIRISNSPSDEYNSNLVFKTNNKNNIDSLLLIIKKRQTCIRQILGSLYSSLVYSDPDLRAGYFSYALRLSENYIYLLDDCQDGRYLNAKVEITNQQEFITLYRQLFKRVPFNGRNYLILPKGFIQLSNNGIHLFHVENDDYKNSMRLDYNGIEDTITTNSPPSLEQLMELKINKDNVPTTFESIIDRNMDEFLYSTEETSKKHEGIYTIEDQGQQLILKPQKQMHQ